MKQVSARELQKGDLTLRSNGGETTYWVVSKATKEPDGRSGLIAHLRLWPDLSGEPIGLRPEHTVILAEDHDKKVFRQARLIAVEAMLEAELRALGESDVEVRVVTSDPPPETN